MYKLGGRKTQISPAVLYYDLLVPRDCRLSSRLVGNTFSAMWINHVWLWCQLHDSEISSRCRFSRRLPLLSASVMFSHRSGGWPFKRLNPFSLPELLVSHWNASGTNTSSRRFFGTWGRYDFEVHFESETRGTQRNLTTGKIRRIQRVQKGEAFPAWETWSFFEPDA